jgi:YD repeat-containing protein
MVMAITVDPFGKIATDLDALGWTMEYGCDL